jgi:hypothetical protein
MVLLMADNLARCGRLGDRKALPFIRLARILGNIGVLVSLPK